MGILERTETLTHQIGPRGVVSVKSISGSLRVRGVDGEQVRLTVNYRIRAGDQATAERALESGRVIVDRAPGSIAVETPERRLSTGLSWLLGGARVTANLDLEVPRGAAVRLETMSGFVEASSTTGEQKYRTVAGDIRLAAVAGAIEAGTISGSIELDRGGDLRLRATSVSGGIRAMAEVFRGTLLTTTSGGVTVSGALDPAADHRVETISGGVELMSLTGVTAELRSISGSIRSDVECRSEGGRGMWRTVVGDGRSAFRVNTTSGSLRLLAVPPAGAGGLAGRPWSTAPWAVPAGAAAGVGSPGSDATGAASTGPVPGSDQPGAPAAVAADETWSTDDSPEPDQEIDEEEQLRVLQALERGEIGIDEAAARLDRARGQ